MNTFYNGDCLEIMSKMDASSIDLTLTDVPYEVVNRDSNGLRNLDKGVADVLGGNLADYLKEIDRITSGSIYIFCSTEQVSEIRAHFAESHTTRLCVWEKTNPSPMNGQHVWLSGIECCVYAKKRGATFNEHCKNTVWRYPTVRGKIHTTQKPLKLFEYLVSVSSNEGDVVLDPFMGSGTTGVACRNLGRRFVGIELNKNYFELGKGRILNGDK